MLVDFDHDVSEDDEGREYLDPDEIELCIVHVRVLALLLVFLDGDY